MIFFTNHMENDQNSQKTKLIKEIVKYSQFSSCSEIEPKGQNYISIILKIKNKTLTSIIIFIDIVFIHLYSIAFFVHINRS